MSETRPAMLVLLVAADPAIRREMTESFGNSGYIVAACDTAEKALALTTELLPEAVVVTAEDAFTERLLERTESALRVVTGGVATTYKHAIRVADAHDAQLLLELLEERYGTRRLPPPSAPPSSRRATSLSGARRMKFAIVIEDDSTLASVLSGALVDEGYAIRVATNLAEGKSLIEQHPNAVLVLDLTLPDGFGGDLLAEAAKRGTVPATVVVSTFGLADVVARRYDAELIKKPFELDAFLAAVERARVRSRPSRPSAQNIV